MLFTVYFCLFPKEISNSIKDGLLLWYNSVLPSVFPFLIITKVLIEIGAINRIGKWLEPIMRPVFNVPGCGAFALIMGGISGYPVGAKITADLRENGALSREEAQRLISFCNNPGPIFMLGAVGTAILGSVAGGYLIVVSNYISALAIGLIFRFYKTQESVGSREAITFCTYEKRRKALPLGSILRESVMYAVDVVVQIGGFILLFSALISILDISRIMTLLSLPLEIMTRVGVDSRLIEPLTAGVFEITNGISRIGDANVAFLQKVVISGMLVSFGGLSIYAQTAGFISKTDISAGIYLFSKILHGILQGLIMFLLYPYVFGAFMPPR